MSLSIFGAQGCPTQSTIRPPAGTSETKETTAAEGLGLTQAGMAALQKCRLLNFLENDDEKRT